MQEANELGKYVTDGKHTYPYNSFLDEMVNSGKLKFCDKPDPVRAVAAAKNTHLRNPINLTLEERTVLAEKLGLSVADVGNMSPQELATAEQEVLEKSLEIKAA